MLKHTTTGYWREYEVPVSTVCGSTTLRLRSYLKRYKKLSCAWEWKYYKHVDHVFLSNFVHYTSIEQLNVLEPVMYRLAKIGEQLPVSLRLWHLFLWGEDFRLQLLQRTWDWCGNEQFQVLLRVPQLACRKLWTVTSWSVLTKCWASGITPHKCLYMDLDNTIKYK